ncbi:MAG TPA: hypothetical protein EYP63_05710 [Desulfotomaculum sp.]|nr:hypothetical protein [Desulfotomaculum sp.]
MGEKVRAQVPAEVLEAVTRAAPGKRITCARALELARELKVSPFIVGAACDALGVKIRECQLGCF